MYNKGTIIAGLVVFALIVTFPIWFNRLDAGDMPEPVLPKGISECVRPAAEMRAKHMKILNEWRDDVLRDGDRVSVTVNGKEYRKGLQTACMSCHTNKEEFCDSCHDFVSVKPTCWGCHLTPKQIAAAK